MRDLPCDYDFIEDLDLYYQFRVQTNDGQIFEMQDPFRLDSPPLSTETVDADANALTEARIYLFPILRGRRGMSSLLLVKQKNGKFRRIGVSFAHYYRGKVVVRERLLRRLDDLEQEAISIE